MYLATDCETGGLDSAKTSILSAYFALLDDEFNKLDECEFFIKPDDGIYRVHARALEVNKINLVEHNKIAMPVSIVRSFLEGKTAAWFYNHSGGTKLLPLGQNVGFDLRFYQANGMLLTDYIDPDITLDTKTQASTLMTVGKLPKMSTRLESLIGYFGIVREGEAHTARSDTLATIELAKRLEALSNKE